MLRLRSNSPTHTRTDSAWCCWGTATVLRAICTTTGFSGCSRPGSACRASRQHGVTRIVLIRLSQVATGIDDTIRQIRTSIFQQRGQLGPEPGTVRTGLLAVLSEVSPTLGFDPRFGSAARSIL